MCNPRVYCCRSGLAAAAAVLWQASCLRQALLGSLPHAEPAVSVHYCILLCNLLRCTRQWTTTQRPSTARCPSSSVLMATSWRRRAQVGRAAKGCAVFCVLDVGIVSEVCYCCMLLLLLAQVPLIAVWLDLNCSMAYPDALLSGAVRALRCQLPRANRFYPPEPPKKTDVRPPQLPGE